MPSMTNPVFFAVKLVFFFLIVFFIMVFFDELLKKIFDYIDQNYIIWMRDYYDKIYSYNSNKNQVIQDTKVKWNVVKYSNKNIFLYFYILCRKYVLESSIVFFIIIATMFLLWFFMSNRVSL
ncbi:MAG: hypothetical protein ACOC56_01315 [Atribacterota bacterium]